MEINRHILVVDDNESIHQDFESILMYPVRLRDEELAKTENELFGNSRSTLPEPITYEIDHAYQGEEAIAMVEKAEKGGNPYALIFMDVRMPPGIDGIQTIRKIWKKFPNVEVVICTAYSDYSWDKIIEHLGSSDNLLFMKKPFDATALKQIALSLTTKWQLKQESIRHTENLEKKVEERTKQLVDLVVEFKKVKENAEKFSKAKSEFLASVSHEIRTPMGVIKELTDLLTDTGLTEKQSELTGLVKHNAETLLHITNDLLDFSKSEAGKMEIEEVLFNFDDLMSEIIKLVSISAKEKNIRVNYAPDEEIPENLIGDPAKIQQILLNYGINAVEFTTEGSIDFSVTMLDVYKEDIYLKFSVKDTGRGIQAESLGNLFEPFSGSGNSANRKYGGTGLGLAICKQLTELMEGETGVKSSEGEGSTFWFTARLKKQKFGRVKDKKEMITR